MTWRERYNWCKEEPRISEWIYWLMALSFHGTAVGVFFIIIAVWVHDIESPHQHPDEDDHEPTN